MSLRTATLLVIIIGSFGLLLRIGTLIEQGQMERFISPWVWHINGLLATAPSLTFFIVLYVNQNRS